MSENTFYLYQAIWWIFVTTVAFSAALLFWKKGRYTVKSKSLEFGLGLKLTGAGGIFVAVLLIFYLINPIKPLKKVFIIYSSKEISELSSDESDEPYVLNNSRITLSDKKFNSDKLVIQMIPCEYVYDLKSRLGDNSFVTTEKIPQGKYIIRFCYSDTGETKEYMVEVPEKIK